jgi:hypothetical protein
LKVLQKNKIFELHPLYGSIEKIDGKKPEEFRNNKFESNKIWKKIQWIVMDFFNNK